MQNSPPIQYMKWLLCIFLFAIPAFGQVHKHSDNALVGLKNMVWAATILYLEPIEDGYRMEVSATDTSRHLVLETFLLTKHVDIDPEILQKPKGKYVWIVWCSEDKYVYLVSTVKANQIVKKK